MGNSINVPKRKEKALPIDAAFVLPSPIPSWPSGGGFAKGTIDLGGLEVVQVSTFTKVWATHEGGPDDLGATFFTPSNLPGGISPLGYYAQPNNKPLFGSVLAARDLAGSALKAPSDYTLVWTSASSKIKQDGVSNGYFWLPTPPDGYKAVGHIVTTSPEKPSLDAVRCVREDLTDDQCENDTWIWSTDGFNVYSLRPVKRGVKELGITVGTFAAEGAQTLACLKNKDANYSCMPNASQVQALVRAYSPWIYFHPDEPYLPSSVAWFFGNGALLFQKGNPNPSPITATGTNLPQGGSNDGAYWIDLPADDSEKERVKKGDIPSCETYLHVKPMFGGTTTDIAIWVFYPFNGPAMAKVGLINVPLGRIGEHVGDWEHMTLRMSNFDGELKKVYFSEHSGGRWVEASELEFEGGNKLVGYASLHGHAFYPTVGLVLQGDAKLGIGIRNDTAKGKEKLDAGARYEVVAAEYAGPEAVAERPWLEYEREWGPKISYDIGEELKKVEGLLPGKLKEALEKVVNGLPDEVLGEEGPTGPKMKDSWTMDER